jgi:2-polyprenyl-3-methyl-5-hydroxy-6-metoxy-1,4-benzoquinol methylase
MWRRIAATLARRLAQRNHLVTAQRERVRVFIVSSAEALPIVDLLIKQFILTCSVLFNRKMGKYCISVPSALVLAAHLQDAVLGQRRILEVGCGLALASLSLHRRHGDVTASDCHPLAGAFLGENLKLNALPALPYLHGDWATVNTELGLFDMIIGSDVLYERDQPGLLAAFIERHSQAAMEVVIVDPDRGNRAGFNRLMDTLGFDREELKVRQLPDGSTPYKGRVLSYARAARRLPT